MFSKNQGCHILKWSRCSYSNIEQQYSIVVGQRTSIGFKLAVHGGTGTDGLVGPLLCTTYILQ